MRIRKKTEILIFHHSYSGVVSVETIQKWHMARGFEDVGYHFLIYPDGKRLRGRQLKYIGSHALGRNSKSIGVCFIGSFDKQHPTYDQIDSAADLYHELCRLYSKSLKIEFHRPSIFNFFEPSSYGRFDACPGKNLDRYDLVEQCKKRDPFLDL